jgi:hypothetical protein
LVYEARPETIGTGPNNSRVAQTANLTAFPAVNYYGMCYAKGPTAQANGGP